MITQTDAEQRTTRWAYDLMGRITSRTLPEGQTESFGYDSSSNLDRHTDFNSATHIFDYDSLDRRISEMYADGSFVTTVYTLTDQVEAVVEARGTTSYTYDERDRLIRIVHPNGKAIDYGYDDAGNQTLLRTVNQSINYTYDALNRLETVTDEGGVTRYFYDAVGNLEAINHANGTRTEHDYDALDRLIEIRQYDGNDGLMDRHVYVLDDAGNRLRHTELSGRIVDYTYDDIYRLQTETVTDPMLGDRTTTYDHDRVGNVVSEVVTTSGGSTTTTYTYDDNDRLITESATGLTTATTTRSYDSNGNEVSRTDGTTTTFYGFDSRNRLVDLNNGQVTYEYDAMGNRQSKTAAGLTTVYLVDAARPFAQVIEESADLNVVADVRYTHGIDLLRQNRRLDAVTTVSKTYHYDGLGSTRQLTDEAGVVSDSYTFSAYGELDASNGATANSYLYAGEQFDGDLDFYYLRSRYYDSGVGRFQSLDTFDGNIRIPLSFNKYLYTHANPVNGIDPSGESLLSLVTQAPWGVTGRTISISAGRRALRKTFSNVLPFLNRKALQREIRNCRQRNKNCKIAVATLLLGSPTGEATEHVFDAQWGNSETAMRPSGFWFRYKDRRGNRSWYRNKEGCKAEDRAEAAVRAKTLLIDCDEFPFFKGTKAGPRFFPGNVSLRAISGSDNRSAGAMYGVLTRIAGLKRNPRERFVVIAWSGFDFSAPLPLNKWTKGK